MKQSNGDKENFEPDILAENLPITLATAYRRHWKRRRGERSASFRDLNKKGS